MAILAITVSHILSGYMQKYPTESRGYLAPMAKPCAQGNVGTEQNDRRDALSLLVDFLSLTGLASVSVSCA